VDGPAELDSAPTVVVTGILNRQIAAALGIAEKTVKVHRGQVMEGRISRRVGATSRRAAGIVSKT
jgi:FixJ family two-component response regulator